MSVLVHKAVEPDKLSRAGKARFAALVEDLIQGGRDAIVQPKYDGVYAQFIHLEKAGWAAFSRTGEHLLSVGHDILDVFERTALVGRRYMGELWLPGQAHQTINGRARKQSAQYLELKLFDSVTMNALDPMRDEPYIERYDYLFEGGPIEAVKNLPYRGKINVLDDLYDAAAALKGRGSSAYDGLILRDANGLFVPGRGTDGEVIKIKPREEKDFRVVGTTRGQGNRAGGIGALVVDLGNGVTCEVGTGLTQKEIFGPDLTGHIVTVEYLSVTKGGLLREPSFKVVRFDKTEADVLEDGGGDD